jgi:two-component system, OmpR family, sensor histidine kinase ArlS
MISNIIDNACKYSENNSAHVKIKFNNSNCIISVEDNGIGISKNEIDRIFEPFYRTQNASNIGGHGIGLSICKKLVEMHKGRIVLKSEIGQGSVFSIIIPHI